MASFPTSRQVKPRNRISRSVGEKSVHGNGIKIPGYHDRRALYLMRGLSGSGKSTYAKKIIIEIGQGEIFSTDDFFMLNKDNEYRFVQAELDLAHKWNQDRVDEALSEGISPVIVDNTNTQFWEMRPYVIAGVENGYNCYFIEPPTDWKFKINVLYRKSNHGLNKGQLVAALKRYEKHPTVEKVIGPGYKPRTKHISCADSNSKNKRITTTAQSQNTDRLVPYNSSDSSDEPVGRKSSSEEFVHNPSQNNGPECSNFRNYNNNSTSPKVINQEGPDERGFERDCGSINLGINNYQCFEKEELNEKVKNQLQCSGESDVAEWQTDISDWMDEMASREMEDELLHKLEKQNDIESEEEEGMTPIIDMQQQRQNSAQQLSTWQTCNHMVVPNDSTDFSGLSHKYKVFEAESVEKRKCVGVVSDSDDQTLQTTNAKNIGSICTQESGPFQSDRIEFVSSKNKLKSAIGSEITISDNTDIDQFIPKIRSLKEICKTSLKSQLIVSYHNSTAYWKAVKKASQLPVIDSLAPLPAPIEPVLTEGQTNKPINADHKPDLLDFYAVVGKDTITLSPMTDTCVSRCSVSEQNKEHPVNDDIAINKTYDESYYVKTKSLLDKFELVEEKDITSEQAAILLDIEEIFGTDKREYIISSCEECDWDMDEILECLLLKESLRELADEAKKVEVNDEQEHAKLARLTRIEPPTIQSLLSGEEGSAVESESEVREEDQQGVELGESVCSSANRTTTKEQYDTKDNTEVASLTLPPALVATLTNMYGTIVGIEAVRGVTIPVNTELASHLHAALYFAHVEGKAKSTSKGKERVRRIKASQCPPSPLFSQKSALPFEEIVKYQSKLPKQKGKLKRLAQAYPGIDESFLDDVLTSCGNELQRALNVLKTDNVRLKYMENEDSLYSTRTETAPQRQQPPSDVQYTSVNPGLPERTRETIVIPPGSVLERAEACRAHSKHNLEQAKLWHSKKQHLVAAHYAKKGTKYRELAEGAEQELFDGTVVKSRLKELKTKPTIDLHGYTLQQGKYLVNEVIKHAKHMIGTDPEYPRTISVITGKGLHSSGGVPRLKYGIRSLLDRQLIQYNEEADGFKVRIGRS